MDSRRRSLPASSVTSGRTPPCAADQSPLICTYGVPSDVTSAYGLLRDVIVHRDGAGYGFTVSGDTPVSVFSVKSDGPAARAGVQLRDRIIKVNGRSVACLSHSEVVEHITSSSSVLLTLERAAGDGNLAAPASNSYSTLPTRAAAAIMSNGSSGNNNGAAAGSLGVFNPASRPLPPLPSQLRDQKEITAPQPLDDVTRRHWDFKTTHTIQLMLEEQDRYVDTLRAQLAVLGSSCSSGGSVTAAGGLVAVPGGQLAAAKLRQQLESAETRRQQLILRLSVAASSSSSVAASTEQLSTAVGGSSPDSAPVPPPRSSLVATTTSSQAIVTTPATSTTTTPMIPNTPSPPPLPSRNRSTAMSSGSVPASLSLRVRMPAGSAVTSSPLSPSLGASPSLTAAVSSGAPPLPDPCPVPRLASASGLSPGVAPPALPPRTYRHQQEGGAVVRSSSSATSTPSKTGGGKSALVSVHQRTKSSPDPVLVQAAIDKSQEGSRRLNSANSMSDLGTGQTAHLLRLPSQPEGMESPLFTPPGTPPPPYGDLSPSTVDVTPGSDAPAGLDLDQSNNSNHEPSMVDTSCTSPSAPSKVNQPFIMSIEDDDLSEQENYQDDHGPFNTLSILLSDHAHLAVFMNYVISNCDSSSLFFYLISALYKEGNPKDMRRWAYEIHSCFLVPGAAMRVPSIDDVTVMKIDEVLMNDVDKVDKLRSVFQRARIKARDEINEQLADFRSKRAAGLGAMFGPRDHELEEARSDRVKEARIVEEVLVRLLETVYPSAELDNASEQTQSQASSLATVLYRHFNCRTPSVQQIVDNCPTFVSKERSFKYKILGRNKKPPGTRGHQFQLHQYYIITFCNVCGDSIRGISPQGYQCAHCEMSIHKHCLRTVEEQCVGANPKRGGDKISKLMERIRPEQRRRGTSAGVALNISATSNDRSKRLSEDPTDTIVLDNDPGAAGDRLTGKDGKRGDQSTERDRKSDEPSGDGDSKSPSRGQRQQNKSSISRSESCRDERERHHNRRYPREKRKHSDPSIPASKTSDAELEADPLGNSTHSGSSSNSSLSARLESPSTSMDSVSVSRLGGLFCEGSPGWDSDMEIDADPPDWKSQVPPDVLRTLRPSEKKRLDVVNELFHTERTHVRNLKILVHAFYRPMLNLNILQANDLNLLFGNVEELLEIHTRFSDAMKRRQRESPMLETVGDVLVNIFEGESGENFKTASAAFCRCQSISLEKLRWLQKRDQRLAAFLTEAESDPVCRRLQLKDILPTGMQRLTKYPLLLSSLVKHTARGTEDHRLVQRACDSSKKILEHVNKVKGETERHERLVEIQSKLDQHAFTRADNPTVVEFNGRLDLTKYRMVHEGSVQFKFSNKSKHAELHMLLLERFIVLLQRQDDKYALKFHTINGREMSPIIKTDNILVRPMATEKRAFFILHNLSVGPHIYELLFGSSNERDTWYRLIKDAADSCQSRDGSSGHGGGGGKGHKRTESAHSVLSHSTSQPLRSSSPAASDDVASAAAAGGRGSTPGRGGSTSTPCTPTVANSPPSAAQQTTPVSTRSPSASADGAGAATAGSPKPARRMQRVEMLKITESTQLIDPTEIVVSQGVVLSADAVLTPLEQLRRKDEQVRRALSEKQQLVADLLHIPRQDYRHVAELADEAAAAAPQMAGPTAAAAEPRELLLSAVHNVDRSLSVLNRALNATEADLVAAGGGLTSPAAAPIPQQTTAAAPEMDQLVVLNGRLSATLSALLGAISERDVERERMRRELRVSHERIHQLERRLGGGSAAVEATSAGGESPHSRPVSYVSVASSLELTEEPEEEEEEQREESSSEDDDGEDMRSLSDMTLEVTTDGKPQHQDSDEGTVNDPAAPTTDQNESSTTQSETTVTSTQEDAT